MACVICDTFGACSSNHEHTRDETCLLGPVKAHTYFYYTRWTWKVAPSDLDGVGPYHSSWETSQPPDEFIKGTLMNGLKDFFIIHFDSYQEMREYAKMVGL